jgi:hypothetical protein
MPIYIMGLQASKQASKQTLMRYDTRQCGGNGTREGCAARKKC